MIYYTVLLIKIKVVLFDNLRDSIKLQMYTERDVLMMTLSKGQFPAQRKKRFFLAGSALILARFTK